MEMEAKNLLEKGYNSSLSVFVPFAQNIFPDGKLAFQLMSPFGGGVSSTSNLCGAVTGAIAAIGLNFGHSNNDDIEI